MPKFCLTFPSEDVETEALGYLAGRASFTTYENGELIVGQYAIKLLVEEGIPFTFHGPATYAQTIPALRLRELEFRPNDTEKS